MNKSEFLEILNEELKKNKVNDREEIIADFNEHFDYKLEEGKTELDVIRKIGNPVEIANDYKKYDSRSNLAEDKIIKIGLVFSDFFTYFFLFLVWLSLFVLAVMSLTFLLTSILLISSINIAGLIPSLPYISSLIFGISMLGLTLITFVGTVFLVVYAKQWHKAYQRWRKNAKNGNIFPSISIYPNPSKKLATKLKLANIIGTITFLVMMTIGYIVSASLAGSFQFWHIWEWFV